jgi:hypothetical protein
MNDEDEDFKGFDAEYADELAAAVITLMMKQTVPPSPESRARVYEVLFALATAAGVALEATGEDIERTRPWFEIMVTNKIAEAKNIRAKRSRN